jgi:CDP-diacylglycerol--glycerol-3-phosphate 3-phosphatidyltransferase/cardiolipin synthase
MPSRAGLRALPNIISSSRVFLAAAFAASNDANARLGLVGLAGLTDFLDGWIARRGKWTSRWGALIDPIADRVFVLVAVLTFVVTGVLSPVGCLVMISRDIMTAVGFIVARIVPMLQAIPFTARFSGTLVTTLQLITFAALLRMPDWITPCLWIVGVASLYSIVDYTYALWKARTK